MSLQCRSVDVAQAANADVKPVWHFIVLKSELGDGETSVSTKGNLEFPSQ